MTQMLAVCCKWSSSPNYITHKAVVRHIDNLNSGHLGSASILFLDTISALSGLGDLEDVRLLSSPYWLTIVSFQLLLKCWTECWRKMMMMPKHSYKKTWFWCATWSRLLQFVVDSGSCCRFIEWCTSWI